MRQLALAMVLVIGCANEAPVSSPPPAAAPLPPPSIEDAATLVSSSPEFSDYQFTNAAYSLALKNPPADVAKALRKAGWISLDGDGNVVLTAKAKADKRWLVRQNGFVDIVPLAKKEFIGASAVRPDPDGAAVDFTWKWTPNEIGDAFMKERYAGTQKATATLLRDGSSWTVLRIKPAA
jgi:hypothetical protein